MSELQKMSLIQCRVTFEVDMNLLVTREMADNEEELKEYAVNMAFKNIDGADEDFDYYHEIPVLVSKKTVQEYEKEILDKDDWKNIIKENNEKREIG